MSALKEKMSKGKKTATPPKSAPPKRVRRSPEELQADREQKEAAKRLRAEEKALEEARRPRFTCPTGIAGSDPDYVHNVWDEEASILLESGERVCGNCVAVARRTETGAEYFNQRYRPLAPLAYDPILGALHREEKERRRARLHVPALSPAHESSASPPDRRRKK